MPDKPRNERMEELTARVEAAEGPDRELDIAVWLAAVADDVSLKAYREGLAISQEEADFRADYMMGGARFTASLDAALTLVPEGWSKSFTQFPGLPAEASVFECQLHDGKWWHGKSMADSGRVKAATPALALTAAALRTRASQPDAPHG